MTDPTGFMADAGTVVVSGRSELNLLKWLDALLLSELKRDRAGIEYRQKNWKPADYKFERLVPRVYRAAIVDDPRTKGVRGFLIKFGLSLSIMQAETKKDDEALDASASGTNSGQPKKDGEGSTPEEIANSSGGPTAGKPVRPGDRERVLKEGRDENGNYTCWRCGWTNTTQAKSILAIKMSHVQKVGISTLTIWLVKDSLAIEVRGVEVHRNQVAVAWKNVAAAD